MSNKKPNVLFIYTDQMRYDCMGNSGNKLVRTPAFDRMAEEGVSFDNAYTSFPLCCPFRGSIMTGKYAHNHGLYANHYKLDLERSTEFLPQIMSKNGYKTGWVGKWHLSGGNKSAIVEKEYQLGFDSFVGFTRGHQYHRSTFYRDTDPTPRKSNMYEPEYQTSHLFEFIDSSLEEDKPFFAAICYGLPHPPFIAPDWYLNLYKPEEIESPCTVPDELLDANKDFMAKYYGLVTCVDNQIMRVLNYLDENNIADETIVIVVSDHGDMAGEHGYWNKRLHFESSMHVPMIVRYPEKLKGDVRVDGMADPSVDIYPTILDMCGIDIPNYCEGVSLAPCMEDSTATPRSEVYYQLIKQPYDKFEDGVSEGVRGVRTQDYLYVCNNGTPAELYDLKNDKFEQNNVIDDEKYAKIKEQYHSKMLEIMKETNDDWNICHEDPLDEYQDQVVSTEFAYNLFSSSILDISKRSKKK